MPGVYDGDGQGDSDTTELFADLEKQDGDSVTPLFDSSTQRIARSAASVKAKRVVKEEEKRAGLLDQFDDNGDPIDEEEQEKRLAKFWARSGSKTIGSKIVLLADILPPVPPKGDFDLERIRDSLYFFS